MPSAIDPNTPVDGVPAHKADFRANFTAIKQEIEHGGFFKQAGTGALERTVHSKLREFDVSVTDFGAVGNGIADDTAAIQATINHIGTTKKTGHSRFLFRGVFKYTPASLDWSAIETEFGGSITMYVDGILRPQGGPVILDGNMHLVGIGGSQGVQFQLGPSCSIQAATDQVGLWIRATGNHTVRNVTVAGSSQPAIRIAGTDSSTEAGLGALYRLENIGVISGTGADADCIRIENVFWLWLDNFSLLCPSTGGWAINTLDIDGAAIAKASGIYYIENGVIAGRGFRFRQTFGAGPGYAGNALFRNIVMESAHTPMFTLDTVNPVDWLTIDRCFMADTVVPPPIYVETLNARANQVILRECGNEIPCKGPVPRNLIIDSKPREFLSSATRKWTDDGTYPRRGIIQIDGEADSRDAFRNAEMLPNLLPVQNLGALQDATAWASSSHFQVTAGQAAPDGSSTAYLLEYGAGGTGLHSGRLYNNASTPMTDGDFLIAGAWLKSAVAGQRMQPVGISVLLAPVNPPLLDGANQAGFGGDERTAYADAGWVMSVDWWKWTGADNAWLVWDFYLNEVGYSYYVWRPFLLRVDGSTHTERDVARIAARVSIVDQNAKTGVLTQLPHHTFRTGLGATGARPSASAVGQGAQWFDSTLNKPIWSDGTAWRDASGSLA